MLQSEKMKCLVLSRYPYADPLKNLLPRANLYYTLLQVVFPYKSLYFECYATMPMFPEIGWFSNRTGTSFDDGKARGKD